MNQVAFLKMKAEMRFQWMMFLRQRILLMQRDRDRERDREKERQDYTTERVMFSVKLKEWKESPVSGCSFETSGEQKIGNKIRNYLANVTITGLKKSMTSFVNKVVIR